MKGTLALYLTVKNINKVLPLAAFSHDIAIHHVGSIELVSNTDHGSCVTDNIIHFYYFLNHNYIMAV